MFDLKALLLGCSLGIAAVGCSSKETTSSANIKTGGIAALIDVNAISATSATVHVELKVGGSSSNTYVALENGDKLIATAGDESKTMTSRDTGIYEAPFSGIEGGTVFSVVLERPGDTTASDNSGTLPDPFDVDEPESGLSRKTDALDVTWAPAGSTADGMDLAFSGDCIFDKSFEATSTATTYTVKADALQSTGGDMPEECDVTLDISRSRSGTADSAFDPESWFRLHQLRATKFTSKP